MIIEKKFLDRLKQFGLNSYEAKIWTALLSRGVSTAGELSDISNVPRSRSYDVLESLEKKGFIIMKVGKPIKYIAVSPENVLERVKKKTLEDTQEQMNILDEIKNTDVFDRLSLLHTEGMELIDPANISGSFKSRDHVYTQIELMIKAAESEIILMTTKEGIVRKLNQFKKHIRRAHERGVSIKVIGPIDDKVLDQITDVIEYIELRSCDKVRARMCIADKKEVTFMLLDDVKVNESFDAGVWINATFFAESLVNLFENVWVNAKEIKLVEKN